MGWFASGHSEGDSMSKKAFPVAACLLLMCMAGECVAYPRNLLSAEAGASVSTSAKLEPDGSIDALLSDGPVSKGGFHFAKEDQDQVFTVNLGGARVFDRVEIGSGNFGQDRCARQVRIEVSTAGREGPFHRVFSAERIGYFQTLRLPLTSARWVRFDLGHGSEGAVVHSVRIYKGYQHPDLAAVTKLLHQRIEPGIPALSRFHAAAKAQDWAKACRLLRAYYAAKEKADPPNPKYDLSRAQALADGKLDFASIVRHEKVPIDWGYSETTDWYEHKNFLNRGSPLGVPVDAYWHTQDPKWARFFEAIFYDWVDANPKPEVMHRADYPTWRTLDSALRSDWLVTRFAKVTHGKDVDDELWANYLYSIWEHSDYLKHDEADGGNWLAMVSAAVMRTALAFPEFADRRSWLTFGKTAFETNVMRDIHPDGKECEDSPGYVCMAYAGMFSTLMALDKAGIPVKPEVRQRMSKALEFIGAALQPNNVFPNIGDGGGAIGYDLLGPMRYFRREDTRYILTQGKEGKAPAAASVNFPNGGWSIMRSSYEERPYTDARHLVFKSSAASHGHSDVLGVTLYAYGRELLIDPGITSYEGADVERYTQTSYHNTICVDGRSHNWGWGKTDRWVTNPGLDYVAGSHVYCKGIDHARQVLFVKPEYWIVWDEVTGEGRHTCDQNWHFAADAAIEGDKSALSVRTRYPRNGNLLIKAVAPTKATAGLFDYLISGGKQDGARDVEAKGWRFTTAGPLPHRISAVLYPYTGAVVPDVVARQMETALEDATVSAVEVRIGDRVDYVVVCRGGPKEVSVPGIGLTANGEVIIVRTKGGKPVGVRGANVKSVVLDGEPLVSYPEPAAEVDITLPARHSP